jgi:DNA-binding transcriptional LysR family regulator
MELSDLKLFQTIAREGSISKAAHQLGYVQSNVTARLKRLEQEVGVLLFYRTSKGVKLTEKGLLFQQYADTMLQTAEEMVQALQDHEQLSGTLRLGVVESLTCGKFIHLVADYQARYTQVVLQIEMGKTPSIMEQLNHYELDAALVTGELHMADVVIDHLITEELVIIAKDELDVSTLATRKWAVSSGGCPIRKRLEAYLADQGITLQHVFEVGSLETLLSSVKAGLTVSLLPQSVLQGAYADLRTYPLPKRYRYMETGLIRRKEKYESQAYQAFRALVKEQGL